MNNLPALSIGSLRFSSRVFLAPMAGVTDVHFRSVIRGFGGCGFSYTELVSAEGMTRRVPRTLEMTARGEGEHPYGVQLYGSRPESMAEAARQAEAEGADLIDINAGCPARKVMRSQGGAHLLLNPANLKAILTAILGTVRVPVTVKIRSGFTADDLNYLQIGRMLEDAGAAAVTLHPRTRAQMFSGHANWEHIARLKATLRIPVIGSGDVFTPCDAADMLARTGCDAVMIGRGIMKNPWLIRQVADYLATGSFTPHTPAQSAALCLRFTRILAELSHPKKRLGEMKKYCSWLVAGFPGAAHHRTTLFRCQDPASLLEQLAEAAEAARTGEVNPGDG